MSEQWTWTRIWHEARMALALWLGLLAHKVAPPNAEGDIFKGGIVEAGVQAIGRRGASHD